MEQEQDESPGISLAKAMAAQQQTIYAAMAAESQQRQAQAREESIRRCRERCAGFPNEDGGLW